MMIKNKFIIFLCLFCLFPCGFASNQWQYADYETTTLENFRDNALFHERIDFHFIDYPRLHAAMFFVSNEQRAKHQLPAITFSKALERAAWTHSQRMVEFAFFSHIDPKSSCSRDQQRRARLAGVKNPTVAENILNTFAIDYESGRHVYTIDEHRGLISYTSAGPPIPPHTYLSLADAMLEQWMDSPGHKANILSTDAIELGTGAAFYRDPHFKNVGRFKATQMFQFFQATVTEDSKENSKRKARR